MKRRLFTILSALSLLLFVAVTALCVQSYVQALVLGRSSRQIDGQHIVEKGWGFYSARGELGFASGTYRESLPYRATYDPGATQALERSGFIPMEDVVHAVGPIRDGDDVWHEMGFALGTADYSWESGKRQTIAQPKWDGEDRRRFVIVPHWFLLLLTSALPTYALTRFAQRRVGLLQLQRYGLCPHCHYDLRATPHRCPECGATPAGKSR